MAEGYTFEKYIDSVIWRTHPNMALECQLLISANPARSQKRLDQPYSFQLNYPLKISLIKRFFVIY